MRVVSAERGLTESAVADRLAAAGLAASVRAVSPTVEDVFISFVDKERRLGCGGSSAPSDRMRLLGMMWKELVQLRRDPMSLSLALIIPVALLFIFGYAINTDVRNLLTVVLDEARDVEAQKLLEAFRNTRYFTVRFQARSLDEVARLIDRGDAKVGIVIPPTSPSACVAAAARRSR